MSEEQSNTFCGFRSQSQIFCAGVNKKPLTWPFQDRQFQNQDRLIDRILPAQVLPLPPKDHVHLENSGHHCPAVLATLSIQTNEETTIESLTGLTQRMARRSNATSKALPSSLWVPGRLAQGGADADEEAWVSAGKAHRAGGGKVQHLLRWWKPWREWGKHRLTFSLHIVEDYVDTALLHISPPLPPLHILPPVMKEWISVSIVKHFWANQKSSCKRDSLAGIVRRR